MLPFLFALLATQSLEEVERSRFAALEEIRRVPKANDPALDDDRWGYRSRILEVRRKVSP